MNKGSAAATPKYRKDYRVSDFLIDHVTMLVDLYETHAEVRTDLQVRANPLAGAPATALRLDGEDLKLRWLAIDGNELNAAQYLQDESSLTVQVPQGAFTLSSVVELRPQDNTRLEGLYKSAGKFCTQCEAEGFRRITFFIDRPDILATYDVTLRAEKALYPHLLGNGNPAGAGDLDHGRHFARWVDPYPKPCYLFALVAGDFDLLRDHIFTRSGRKVDLRIYVDKGKLAQCDHAMASLKRAMRWDEQVYGREYDLDVYQIVAVSDFNMGAMENKGLNIFNTKYVLAHRDTATDTDYEGVESVIAHEYFHNWTGNRVTCRDWFQLSLKEGLTVFRDQCFSQDMGSATVKRIDDVRIIRTAQFSEDAGPMAHPIRPDSYVEMNNFYTVTVYNKGAEVIRMLHALLGADGFRKGMDLYFQRHDGQAVTCDDFVQAHADANGVDLTQFRLWYAQAGTPVVTVSEQYDAARCEYRLHFTQSCAATPGQDQKQAFLIPIRTGLLDAQGQALMLRWHDADRSECKGEGEDVMLPLSRAAQTFVFTDIDAPPVASLLRDFSAPVKLEFARSDAQLAFLLRHDSNPFNRWDALQTLATREFLRLASDWRAGQALALNPALVQALQSALADNETDAAVRARLLQLPDIAYVQEQVGSIDIDALIAAQQFLRRELAVQLSAVLAKLYADTRTQLADADQRQDGEAIAARALSSAALQLWLETGDAAAQSAAFALFSRAGNMTDRFAALRALVNGRAPQRVQALEQFAARHAGEALVMDKWFAVQAQAPLDDTLDVIAALEQHPLFDRRNPNKVRALYGTLAHSNPLVFHRADGAGYAFIAGRVAELNDCNPQIASRLISSFNRWRRYDERRQQLMLGELKRMLARQGLSPDVFEIVSKAVG